MEIDVVGGKVLEIIGETMLVKDRIDKLTETHAKNGKYY